MNRLIRHRYFFPVLFTGLAVFMVGAPIAAALGSPDWVIWVFLSPLLVVALGVVVWMVVDVWRDA